MNPKYTMIKTKEIQADKQVPTNRWTLKHTKMSCHSYGFAFFITIDYLLFFSLSLPNFSFCLVLFYYFLGLFSIVSTDLFKTLSDFLFTITIKFYSFSLSLISLLFQSYLFRIFFSLFYFLHTLFALNRKH